jgi:hypothetical protein
LTHSQTGLEKGKGRRIMTDSTRLYKTKSAAIRNAEKLTAEYLQVGIVGTWTATQKPNGYWTLTKREGNK